VVTVRYLSLFDALVCTHPGRCESVVTKKKKIVAEMLKLRHFAVECDRILVYKLRVPPRRFPNAGIKGHRE
jgi:hypothetical protein